MNELVPKIQYNLSIENGENLELHSETVSDDLIDAFDVEIGEALEYDEFSKRRFGLDNFRDSSLLEVYELLETFAYEHVQEALHSDYVKDRSEARRMVRDAYENSNDSEQIVYDIARSIRDYGPTRLFDTQAFQEDLEIRFEEFFNIEVTEE